MNRFTRDGKADSIEGTAKIAVTFFWPFSDDYRIIERGAAYEYAVVSEPDRSYLWVLSRTSVMEDRVYEGIVERLRDRGFHTDRLLRTQQKGN